MGESISPLPQYAFMAWCSVKRNTGTTLPFTFTLPSETIFVRRPVLELSSQVKTPGSLGRERNTGQVVRDGGRTVLSAMMRKERNIQRNDKHTEKTKKVRCEDGDQFCSLRALICLSNLSIILSVLSVSRVRYVQSWDHENKAEDDTDRATVRTWEPVLCINNRVTTYNRL
jgi:hypothetical protein